MILDDDKKVQECTTTPTEIKNRLEEQIRQHLIINHFSPYTVIKYYDYITKCQYELLYRFDCISEFVNTDNFIDVLQDSELQTQIVEQIVCKVSDDVFNKFLEHKKNIPNAFPE